MVIVSLAGGLGNQMFRYAMGYATARRNNTQLFLDCRYFKNVPLGQTPRDYELWRFNLTGRPIGWPQKWIGAVARIYPPAGIAGKIQRALPIRMRSYVDPHDGYNSAAASAPAWSFLDGHWQSQKYFMEFRDDLKREFSFKAAQNAANAAVVDQIEHGGPGEAICVHVRRSDYLDPAQIFRPAAVTYYEQALGEMARRVPVGRYFAFSDDPTWARSNLPWPAGTVFVSHNVGVDDAEDLRLMSHCAHFIIANSTFSWWGAWLGRHQDKVVIAPQRWFAKPHPSEGDLIPENWIRL